MIPTALRPRLPRPGGVAGYFDPVSASLDVWGGQKTGGSPVMPNTRFPIASLTKTFTAHLLLEVLRETNLSLQTPIAHILPGFALADPAASCGMTLEDALCHYSGLPPHTWAWVYSDVDRKTFIHQRLPHLQPLEPHRQAHRYSNILYAVLGYVVEILTDKTWEQNVQERILTPLGMTQTGFLTESWAADSDGLAQPHNLFGKPIPFFYAKTNHLIAPASEMISTADDLVRWGQYLLTLPPNDDRWRARNTVPGKRPLNGMGALNYGLGWRIERLQGELRVWHSGQCSGYSSLFVLYPERKQGGVYLSNASGVVTALQVLDLESRTRLKCVDQLSFPKHPPERPKKKAASGIRLPEGHFLNPGYGTLTVELQEEIPYLTYQCAPKVPALLSTDGTLWFRPPGYTQDIRMTCGTDEIHLHFESELCPTDFRRQLQA